MENHGVRGHLTVHGQKGHPLLCGLPESGSEVRVGLVVGTEPAHRGHLDDEEQIGPEALRLGLQQTPDVLGSPLGGGIREGTDPVFLQCAALDLQKAEAAILAEGEVEPGIAVDGFGPEIRDLPQTACGQPFPGGLVGGLGIHVDKQGAFLNADQVIAGFPGGAEAVLTIDAGSDREKLPASACVFDMADLLGAVDLNVGDEAVGAGAEDPRLHICIVHGITSFPFQDSRI